MRTIVLNGWGNWVMFIGLVTTEPSVSNAICERVFVVEMFAKCQFCKTNILQSCKTYLLFKVNKIILAFVATVVC